MVFADQNKLELHLASAFVQIWLFLAQLLTLLKFTHDLPSALEETGNIFSLSYTPIVVDL